MPQNSQPPARPDRVALAILLALGLVWFLYRIRLVLMLLLGSAWLAYAIDPLVFVFSARQRRLRPLGIALAYLAVLLALGVVAAVALGPAVRDARDLATNLPTYAAQLEQWERHVSATYLERLPPGARPLIDQTVTAAGEQLQALGVSLARRSVALVLSFGGWLAAGALMLLISALLLQDKEYLMDALFRLIPSGYHDDAARLLGEIDGALSAFVHGQLLVATLVGTTLIAGMTLLHMQYAVLLGFFTGLAQLIPDVGAAVGLIAAIILAAFQSFAQMVKVTVLFVVVYQLAARVLSPWVMSRAVHIRPLIIIVATVAGAVLGGVVGALVAVPVVAVLKVVAAFVYGHLAPRYRLGPPPT